MVEKNLKKKFLFLLFLYLKKIASLEVSLIKKNAQGKYISVIQGKILDVVVDIRKNSKTFGKHFSIILSNENCKSIYIPEGFAHGFAALDKLNIVIYSCTKYRDKDSEQGILWNGQVSEENLSWSDQSFQKKIIRILDLKIFLINDQ